MNVCDHRKCRRCQDVPYVIIAGDEGVKVKVKSPKQTHNDVIYIYILMYAIARM